MNGLIVISIAVAVLILAGQWYLHSRRRKAAGLLERLARGLGAVRRGGRIEIVVHSRRVVIDAQVMHDDRPEELRLTITSSFRHEFRLTAAAGARHYADSRPAGPPPAGGPFAGWHVHSEDPGRLEALWGDHRFRGRANELAGLGFTRIELAGARLVALWPGISWSPGHHPWGSGDADGFPGNIRRAAEALSELAAAAGAGLPATGDPFPGRRARARLTALLVVPLLLMLAGIGGMLYVYDLYPPVSDEQLLILMLLSGAGLAAVYAAGAWLLLRHGVQRGARTAVAGFVALFGLALASSIPILWWNGAGVQDPGHRVTVQVLRLDTHSPLDSGRGKFIQWLIGKSSAIEKWSTTHRAIVRSWRDDSVYAIHLTAAQLDALPPAGGRLSFTVHPGALGMEWYSGIVVASESEAPDPHRKVE